MFYNIIRLLKPDGIIIREICLEAQELFINWGISKNRIDDLVLAIEEALSNIREHGYKKNHGNSKEISLELIRIERDVIILINDKADSYSLEDAPRINPSSYLENHVIGGFGIKIIKELMDSVKLLRIEDRNILIMTKEIV